jgi:hypothetical protein
MDKSAIEVAFDIENTQLALQTTSFLKISPQFSFDFS